MYEYSYPVDKFYLVAKPEYLLSLMYFLTMFNGYAPSAHVII